MQQHNLTQGGAEWLAHRAACWNASDAPAMLGCSTYKTRQQLLKEIATGITPEVDAGTQRRFDDGHRFEALARPLGEKVIGEDLSPLIGSIDAGLSRPLSASFDGITFMADFVWEHKSLNDELRAVLPDHGIGDTSVGATLPMLYRVQMEQQAAVSGAGRVLFTASKWRDDELIEARHCWYQPNPSLRAQILAGWKQFEADVAAYVPTEAAEAAPVGKAPETLPALRIEVTGAVTASNLAEFKETALTAIRSVNRTLQTDQDFADAAKAVKWCEDVETRLKAAKEHALSQTADIDALFKALDDIGAEAKAVRLDLDKLVKRRKDEVKEEAVMAARRALDEHIAAVNAEIAPMRLLPVAADFAGAIKGLRSIASMQNALDTTLAAAKIATDTQARNIRANINSFEVFASGFEFLFSDLSQLIHKHADDFGLAVRARIDKHKADEAARLERERERIRAEEAAKLVEAQQKAEAARLEREQREEAERQARELAEAAQRAEAAEAQATNTPPQGAQQVLKAEATSPPDATDRAAPASASPEEAHGKAIALAQADFPEHLFHTACHWTLQAPAEGDEPTWAGATPFLRHVQTACGIDRPDWGDEFLAWYQPDKDKWLGEHRAAAVFLGNKLAALSDAQPKRTAAVAEIRDGAPHWHIPTLDHVPPKLPEGTLLYTHQAQAPAPAPQRLPLAQATAPRKIWLQASGVEFDMAEPFPDNHEGITWCEDEIGDGDVPYIRADLAAPAPAVGAEKPVAVDILQITNELRGLGALTWRQAEEHAEAVAKALERHFQPPVQGSGS